ncbi:MAG: hypothetical protein WBG32_20305 [Nodosilinea sp.]
MAEPITTLSDYAIALECLLFAGLLLGRGWVERLWAIAFGSVGGAAFLGGTIHGFSAVLTGDHHLWLWKGMLLALAIASFVILAAAAVPFRRRVRLGLLVLAIAKLALVTRQVVSPWAFAISVADYLSALVVVFLMQLGQSRRQSSRCPREQFNPDPAWLGAGIVTSGLAASVLVIPWPQTLAISPLAGYHLVQMVALYCIYRAVPARSQGQNGP